MKKNLIVIIVILGMLLGACGKVPSDNKAIQETPNAEIELNSNTETEVAVDAEIENTMLVQFNEEFYPFPGGYKAADIARIDNHLLIMGRNENSYTLVIADYSFREDGTVSFSDPKSVKTQNKNDDGFPNIYNITSGGDGYYYLMSADYKDNIFDNIKIERLSASGEILGETLVTDWPLDDYIKDFKVTENGNIVINGYNIAGVLPWQGTNLAAVTVNTNGNYIVSSSLTKEGVVFSAGGYLFLFNDKTLETSQLIKEPNDYSFSFTDCYGLNGEYISNNAGSFAEYDFDTNATTEILRWNYKVESTKSFGPSCRLSNNVFVCSFTDRDALLLTGLKQVPYTERSIVNVALIGVSDFVLEEFNSENTKYECQATEYSENEIDQFLVDMSLGNAPDLVISKSNLKIGPNMYENLFEYIDSDPDLSRDGFIPHYLDALSEEGKLPQIWDQVAICTLVARQSDVGNGYGLWPEDYNSIVDENPDYYAVFQSFMSKTNLLEWIARIGISTFVDFENPSCNFNNEQFQSLLEWCREMGDDIVEGSDQPVYDISETLLSFEYITSLMRLESLLNIYREPISFVGFPNGAEGYSYYTISGDTYGKSMAIPQNSSNKEGAWEFIKWQLSFNHQVELGKYANIPVNAQALQHKAESELSNESKNFLADLLSKVCYAEKLNDNALINIIVDSGQGFIYGDKTIEDTVDIIQSRSSIYVAEQYG